MRILVVEEDEVLRQVLAGWLRRLKHTVRAASSARGALTLLESVRPGLVVVGLDLPDRSGLGLIREIRRLHPEVAIIASGEQPEVRQLMDLIHIGVLDFLELPFSSKTLHAALERVPKTRRVRGTAEATAPGHSASLPSGGSGGNPRNTLTRLLSTGLIKLIKEGRVDVPVIAPVARDIQRLLEQPTCGIDEIVEVVRRDPAVVRGVLKVAGSSYFRGRAKVVRLEDACSRLGNRRVLGIAQRVIVGDLFSFGEGGMSEVVAAAWRNLIVTAHGARAVAADVGHPDPDGVYVAALFHNIGEVVLLRVIAERLEGAGLGEGVDEHLGGQLLLQHEAIGRMVLEGWRMPPSLVQLAGSHHLAPRSTQTGPPDVAQLCMFAWTMAIERGYTYVGAAGNVDPVPWVEALGMDLFQARRFFVDAPRWIEEAAA